MTDFDTWTKALTTLRAVWIALLLGAAGFFSVAVVSGAQRAGGGNQDAVLSIFAGIFAAACLTALIVLPPALSKAAALKLPTPPPAAALAGVWLQESVVGWALLEGALLNGGIAYLLESRTWVLVPAAALLAAFLWRYPTVARRDAFLRRIGQAPPGMAGGDDQFDHLRPGGD